MIISIKGHGEYMKLSEAITGNYYKVVEILHSDLVGKRMNALGLTSKTSIYIFHKKRNGTMIIKVRGTRLAIGKPIADGILVKEILHEEN